MTESDADRLQGRTFRGRGLRGSRFVGCDLGDVVVRHLVMATDTWLGRAILEQGPPYHPAGLPNDAPDIETYDGAASPTTPLR